MVKTKLSAADRDALTRALEKARANDDPGGAEQIERMLKKDDWFKVATFAAYCCQVRALGLKPWQPPPAYGHIPMANNEHADAAALLKRLFDAGLSRYEPDPIGALEETTWHRG